MVKDQKRSKTTRGRKWFRGAFISVLVMALLCFAAHTIVVVQGKAHILDLECVDGRITSGLPDQKTDCILILGAGLQSDGTPSPMLRERLDMGAALYDAGAADKILVSGDNGSNRYDEVGAMERYLTETLKVPQEAIVKDHAGFCTYDSMVRAKKVFCVESAIVVTQKYHLFRALYIAAQVGFTAYGADAERVAYAGKYYREARECLARVKDFFGCLFQVRPKYLGEQIPIQS